jgi:hypothetical protein
MRAKLLAVAAGAVLSAVLATGAASAPILAKDGRFEADVSARQMSRIAIQGEKVVSVRNINDPTGPQVMIETDEATGDVFVGFDGDVSGRAFSVFLTTESGKTVQAVLHPMEAEGQSVIVRLEGSSGGAAPSGPGPGPQRADRRSTYPETLVAFTRLMFTGDMPDGVVRRRAWPARPGDLPDQRLGHGADGERPSFSGRGRLGRVQLARSAAGR